MATILTPSQIQSQYFTILQNIQPAINTNDANSDFVIRGNVFAAFASGLYADQENVDNDTYISTSRPEALTQHGVDLGVAQEPATKSASTGVEITGINGTVIAPGDLTFFFPSTGVQYTNTTGGTIALGILIVSAQAITAGSIGNVLAPATLQLISPPAGVNSTASLNTSLTDGTDVESTDSYRQRLLNRIQQPPSGGNTNDYHNFAFAADPSVRTVQVIRFGRGLGTVDIYITVGTTDIDTAVTKGLSIIRVPSPTVIATVQTYYNNNAPLTDCPSVYGPTEIPQNATINVILAAGYSPSSIPADPVNNPLNLTVDQLIQREVGRALYKVPVGGWLLPGITQGWVIAAYIEESFDVWLSSEIDQTTGLAIGNIPVVADRQIQQLNPPDYDKQLAGNEIVAPGTITVVYGGINP